MLCFRLSANNLRGQCPHLLPNASSGIRSEMSAKQSRGLSLSSGCLSLCSGRPEPCNPCCTCAWHSDAEDDASDTLPWPCSMPKSVGVVPGAKCPWATVSAASCSLRTSICFTEASYAHTHAWMKHRCKGGSSQVFSRLSCFLTSCLTLSVFASQ